MGAEISLDKLTVKEKLELMERLWDELSKRPDDIPSPSWHGDVLAERVQALKEGRTEFVDWEEAKQRLRSRYT